MQIPSKICSQCYIEKSSDSFNKDSRTKSGLQSWCKDCKKDLNKIIHQTQEWKDYNSRYHKTSEQYKSWVKRRYKERRQTDIEFKLRLNLRNRVGASLYRSLKGREVSAVKDLGCSINEFKQYIESKWLPGMSWDNYGRTGWHLDHIIPLKAFKLATKEEQKLAVHYTNYQPLWAIDNLRKNASLPLTRVPKTLTVVGDTKAGTNTANQ